MSASPPFTLDLKTPEGGGGTRFPGLNITIQPKKGTALLWPNVLDSDLRRSDSRTMHEALPPTGGLKFSANLWLHQYDFRGPNRHGCDMARYIDRSSFAWPSSDADLAERTNRTWGTPVMPPRVGGEMGRLEDDEDHEENDEL